MQGPVVAKLGDVPVVSETLVPGSCSYCNLCLKKPWDVIVHLVEEHEVRIRYVQCGDGLPLDSDVVCYFCGQQYATPEDTYFHVIVDHGHYVFGRGSVTDYCCVEMVTKDSKSLKLKAKIKANPLPAVSVVPVEMPLPGATLVRKSALSADKTATPKTAKSPPRKRVTSVAGDSEAKKPRRKQNLPRVKDLTSTFHGAPSFVPAKKRPKPTNAKSMTRKLHCILCGQDVHSQSAMVLHLKEEHSPPFQCPKCPTTCQTLTHLFEHAKVHLVKPKDAAPKLPRAVGNGQYNMPARVTESGEDKQFQCLSCAVQLDTHEALKAHAKTCVHKMQL